MPFMTCCRLRTIGTGRACDFDELQSVCTMMPITIHFSIRLACTAARAPCHYVLKEGWQAESHLSFFRFFDLGVDPRALAGRAASACFASALGTAVSDSGSFAGLAASGSAAALLMLAA